MISQPQKKTPTSLLFVFCGVMLIGCQTDSVSTRPSAGPAPASTEPLQQASTPTGVPIPEVVSRSHLRERALSVLEEAALSEWALLRANAIEGMEAVPARAEPFVRAGLADENIGVRFTALMVAGRLRLEKASPLIRPLLRDPDGSVRAAAMYALHRLGEPVNFTPISESLLRGMMSERKVAAFVLGEIRDRSAVPLLHDASRRLQSSESESLPSSEVRLLRLQIGEALVKLGEESALNAIRAALYPATLEEMEASVLAAQILGQVDDGNSAAELVRLVTRTTPDSPPDADPMSRIYLYPKELRLAAARSLAQLGYPDGWYVGHQYLGDPLPAVRAQVAFVLAETGRDADLGHLEGLMGDSDPIVRVAAAAGVLRMLESPRPRRR